MECWEGGTSLGDRGELGGEGGSGVRGGTRREWGPPFNGLEGVGERDVPGP